jgi:hypothetical protein
MIPFRGRGAACTARESLPNARGPKQADTELQQRRSGGVLAGRIEFEPLIAILAAGRAYGESRWPLGRASNQ